MTTSSIVYTSQSRLSFNPDELLEMGITRAYVTPFDTNNECLLTPDKILANLDKLAQKAEIAGQRGLEVYPFFVTINHPDGNYQVPSRYRRQRNLDGSERSDFICFLDTVRQEEMIQYASKAAELGFGRVAYDDDFRDAFCFCDEHLKGFEPFTDKSRECLVEILNGVLTHPEHEELRQTWYEYKYEGLCQYAGRLKNTIHRINPACRIGLCNSAKRCHDFSGRDPWQWLQVFDTPLAPTFVRLCGECYDDDLMHLAQSTGWHAYFDRSIPSYIERKLEVTSVPDIGYRSPGAVTLEAQALVAATGVKTIHWAWTEDFGKTGLPAYLPSLKETLGLTAPQIKPSSPLAIYIGHQLGAYTPTDICTTYGASHDPMKAYNIISMVGLPMIPVSDIPESQPAALCSSYLSRTMVVAIDRFVAAGGTAVLDAIAASSYRIYGGKMQYTLNGPVPLNRYEIAPDGQRDDTIADAPWDAIYLMGKNLDLSGWQSFDTSEKPVGLSTAIMEQGKGKLVILGYDLSRCGSVLLRPQWRERMIRILAKCNVTFPVYWDGPVGVQCFQTDQEVTVINYNHNEVSGHLVRDDKTRVAIRLDSYKMERITLTALT